MCGIIAAITPPHPAGCPPIEGTIRQLGHCGPDHSGTARIQLPWASATLGQARLPIVDQTKLLSALDELGYKHYREETLEPMTDAGALIASVDLSRQSINLIRCARGETP